MIGLKKCRKLKKHAICPLMLSRLTVNTFALNYIVFETRVRMKEEIY